MESEDEKHREETDKILKKLNKCVYKKNMQRSMCAVMQLALNIAEKGEVRAEDLKVIFDSYVSDYASHLGSKS